MSHDGHADDRPFQAEVLLAELARERSSTARASSATRDLIVQVLARWDEPQLQLVPTASHDADQITATIEYPLSAVQPGALDASRESLILPITPPIDVPNHTLERCIGAGGFGQVWIARHDEGFRLACKLIHCSKSLELEAIIRLKHLTRWHKYLFPLEQIGRVGDWHFVFMPLAENANEGTIGVELYEPLTLATWLTRHTRFSAQDVKSIGTRLCATVDWLHRHGHTHGDIKPSNIMRYAGQWMIADFGLVRDSARPTGTGHSPMYAPHSPEKLGTNAADQYSLGAVFMRMLTGWPIERLDEFRTAQLEQLDLDSGGIALSRVILQAISVPADKRYASVREFGKAIRRAEKGSINYARHRLQVAAGLLFALVVLAIWFIWIKTSGPAGPSNAKTTVPPIASSMPAAIQVESFQIRYFKNSGNDAPYQEVGLLGQQIEHARLNDSVKLQMEFSSPVYAYIVALDPTGTVKLVYPCGLDGLGDPDAVPSPVAKLEYPSGDMGYGLGNDPGSQAFILIASSTWLSSWNEWSARHGIPHWPGGESLPEGIYFDGTTILPLVSTRGGPVTLGLLPKTVSNIVTWARRSGVEAVRMVAFPLN